MPRAACLPVRVVTSRGHWRTSRQWHGLGCQCHPPDWNWDGTKDTQDVLAYLNDKNADSGLGRGEPSYAYSTAGGANRRAYAGYEIDPILISSEGWESVYHVRHRVLLGQLGRWTRRDPLEYFDGPNMYGFVAAQPVMWNDSHGLTRPCLDYRPIAGADSDWQPGDPLPELENPHRFTLKDVEKSRFGMSSWGVGAPGGGMTVTSVRIRTTHYQFHSSLWVDAYTELLKHDILYLPDGGRIETERRVSKSVHAHGFAKITCSKSGVPYISSHAGSEMGADEGNLGIGMYFNVWNDPDLTKLYIEPTFTGGYTTRGGTWSFGYSHGGGMSFGVSWTGGGGRWWWSGMVPTTHVWHCRCKRYGDIDYGN